MKIFLIQLLKKEKLKTISLIIKKRHIEKYKQIIQATNYLPKDCKFTERIYQILNNLSEKPKCAECATNTKFITLAKGYSNFCSLFCANNNKEKQKKTDKTKLKKYGNSNYNNRTKFKQTNLEKYGDEYYNNNKQIKKSLKEKTLKEWHQIRTQQKETLFNRYGAENYNNRNQMKTTKLKNYGQSNYVNVDKMMETKRKRGISPFGRNCGIYKEFYYESKWELAFIKYCLKNDVKIERNSTGFEYWYLDKKRKYYPDFYLPEVDQYIEIKNNYLLKQEKEQEKIKQFPYKLDVYNKEKMEPILKETK